MAKNKTKKEQHPLYNSWTWMRRMHTKFAVCDGWYNDFYLFVKEMGERPSPDHRVNRKDSSSGFSKNNCEWREIIPSKDKAEYQRKWRKANPDKAKNNELKKMFGITLKEYNEMLEKQNHTCAICDGEEKFNGSLAVDHCHSTGKIRGLLCTNCNRGIGHLKDSISNLQSAIEYLS